MRAAISTRLRNSGSSRPSNRGVTSFQSTCGFSATSVRIDEAVGVRATIFVFCLSIVPRQWLSADKCKLLSRSYSRTGCTPARNGYPVVPESERPSAVHSSRMSTAKAKARAPAPSGNSSSCEPCRLSRHNAITLDSGEPGLRHSCAIPRLVTVNTEQPGSSASTVAYLAGHRTPSCGPSIRIAMTRFGPTDRRISSTGSRRARSSQISADTVSQGRMEAKFRSRRPSAMCSHHNRVAFSEPPKLYCTTCDLSKHHR